MSKLITIKEASERIGVSRQNIINWGNDGIIKIRKMKEGKNQSWYVDEDCMMKLADAAFGVEEAQKRLCEIHKETISEKHNAEMLLQDIKKQIRYTRRFANMVITTEYDVKFVDAMHKLGKICEREALIMKYVLKGNSFDTIAEMFGLTRCRISQIFFRACKKCGEMDDIKDCMDNNKELSLKVEGLTKVLENIKWENKFLKEKLHIQEEEQAKDWLDENDELFHLLMSPLIEFDFTIRALNCLKGAGLQTVGDLIQCNRLDLLKLRNFGRKTLTEVDDFLEDHNLGWGFDVDKFLKARMEYMIEKQNN